MFDKGLLAFPEDLEGLRVRTGGESGIRTHGTVSRTHAFQACALSHSAISPEAPLLKGRDGFCKGARALGTKFR